MYTIEGTVSLEDYVEANRLHKRAKGSGLIAKILLLIILVAGSLDLIIDSFVNQTWVLLIGPLALIGAVLLYYLYIPYQAKKIYQQQKTIQMPFTITISNEGLHVKNQFGEGNYPWNIFSNWKEGDNLILLFHSDLMFTILPKRYLNEGAIQLIHERLKSNNILEK